MCEPDSPRSVCAHAFQEIALTLGRFEARAESIDRKVNNIHAAVLGNGDTEKSLASRVARLEAESRRTWKIVALLVGAAGVLVAVLT